MSLSAKQKDYFLNSRAKINISHGAVRSGKTFITNLRWLDYIRNGPPGKLLMSGRTTSTLKDNVLDDIFTIVGEGNYSYKESTGELVMFGRKIKCVGAEKIDAEARIRGQTYAGWYGDEITIQHPQFVKQAITRCSVPRAQIFWTTNPDHPKHFIKTDFIDNDIMKAKGQVKVWHFKLEDNKTLSSDYIELLKNSFGGVFYKRNIDGLWVLAEGVVYGDDYKPEIHKIPKKLVDAMIESGKFIEYIAGTDFGYTHPMTGLIYGVTDDEEPQFIQVAEYYRTQQKTEDLAQWYLKQQDRLGQEIRVIFCDAAEPDRILTLKSFGLHARAAHKELMAGINSVQMMFKQGRLFISDDCENTDLELQTYTYPDPEDLKAKKDEPLDQDNHAMDAKRYAIHNYLKFLLGQSRKKKRDRKLSMV